MRETLEKYKGKFVKIRAVVVRYGWEIRDFGQGFKTLLLCHVRDSKGHYLTSHAWVKATNHLTDVNLMPGDVVEFTAQVMWYQTPNKADYGFTTIRDVRKSMKIRKGEKLPVTA